MNLNTVDLRERIALCADFTPQERDFILDALTIVAPAHAEVHDAPNYLGRIDAIWAALSIDDGGEGVCAAPVGRVTLPLIAADKRRLDQIRPLARQIAVAFRKPVRIAKFSSRTDVEIFQP